MPNIVSVEVESPSQVLNAGAYGSGALIRIQSATTSTGTFANLSGTGSTPTIAIVAGTNAYTGYDPNGTTTTWYRTRYENAGGTRLSDWSSPFQVASGRTQVVTAEQVRTMIGVDANAAKWSDTSLDGHILAAQDELEHSTGRWFVDRPSTTFTVTTNGRAQVYIPGFRTISSVSFAGATLDSTGFYPINDLLQSGVYTAIQLRPFTSRSRQGGPWWLHLGGATTNWFDTNADSPYDPRNYGGGYAEASLPNDLVISGDGGFATANLPGQFLNAVKFLAAFYAARTSAILADVAITPAGGVLNYAQFQAEANAFIQRWKIGEQAVSV